MAGAQTTCDASVRMVNLCPAASFHLARRAQLTRHYQLADPEHFVLRALASAVSSGAGCFCVEVGGAPPRSTGNRPPRRRARSARMAGWLQIQEVDSTLAPENGLCPAAL